VFITMVNHEVEYQRPARLSTKQLTMRNTRARCRARGPPGVRPAPPRRRGASAELHRMRVPRPRPSGHGCTSTSGRRMPPRREGFIQDIRFAAGSLWARSWNRKVRNREAPSRTRSNANRHPAISRAGRSSARRARNFVRSTSVSLAGRREPAKRSRRPAAPPRPAIARRSTASRAHRARPAT
jgi:hypothetical protein